MTFRVGQKVVCVDAGGIFFPVVQSPKAGAIYTVRGLIDGVRYNGERGIGVVLVELHNPLSRNGREHSFEPARFRPIVDTETKISFTEGAPKDSEHWDNRIKQPARV